MESSTRRVLIPAAGFGKRAGSPAAKELLPDPETGSALIERAIESARRAGAWPVVITRRDKHALIEALAGRSDLELLLIESSREWPDTLLQSEPAWRETNIVILPDTRFAPAETPARLFEALESGAEVAYAIFETGDYSAWGVIASGSNGWQLCEKPNATPDHRFLQPWGLFGWRQRAGAGLLAVKLASSFDHQWKSIPFEPALFALDSFEDLTRFVTTNAKLDSIAKSL